MNILQILPGKVWGGAEQYILDMGSAFIAEGHQVRFLTCNSKVVKKRVQSKYKCDTLPFLCPLDFISAFRLAHILRQTSPEVIHIHNIKYVPIVVMSRRLAKSKAKIVLTVHDVRPRRISFFLRRFYAGIYRIIFVSGLSKSLWTKTNPWLPEERCQTVLNSIPPANDQETGKQPESLRRKYDIAADVPLLVFMGRVRKSKGCEVLLHALARLKHLKFHLVYIGRGKPKNYPKYLQKVAEKEGIDDQVSFYGFSTNVRQLLEEADIGVAPSIMRESGSLSVLEFMQAGKCVITTHNGGQPEYISDQKTGLLVAPGNVEQLADAIRIVLENPLKRQQLSQAARNDFNRYLNYELFIKEVLTIYTSH